MENKDLVFGINTVTETIKAGSEIDRILIQKELEKSNKFREIIDLARAEGIPISKAPLFKFNKITRKNHQGVLAFISAVKYLPLHNVLQAIFEEGRVPFFLILDRITDVRNFGAICRTAECAGVDAIIIPKKETAQINSDAMKTSSGALNFISVCREDSLKDAVQFLKDSGLQIIACSEKGEKNIYEVDFTVPTAIIMGSEDDGISMDMMKKADLITQIPMSGKINSLNVSVATGIILFEAVRQKI